MNVRTKKCGPGGAGVPIQIGNVFTGKRALRSGGRQTCKSMKVRSWSQKCTRRRTSGREKTRHLKVWRYAAGNEKAQDTRDLDARGPGAYKYGGTDPAPSSKQRGAGVLEDLHTSGAKQPEGQKYEGTQGGRTSIPLGQNRAKVKSMEVWPTFDL